MFGLVEFCDECYKILFPWKRKHIEEHDIYLCKGSCYLFYLMDCRELDKLKEELKEQNRYELIEWIGNAEAFEDIIIKGHTDRLLRIYD